MNHSTNNITEAMARAQHLNERKTARHLPRTRAQSERDGEHAKREPQKTAIVGHRQAKKTGRKSPAIRPFDIFMIDGEQPVYYQIISVASDGIYARWIKRRRYRSSDGSIVLGPAPGRFADGTRNERVLALSASQILISAGRGNMASAKRLYTAAHMLAYLSRAPKRPSR